MRSDDELDGLLNEDEKALLVALYDAWARQPEAFVFPPWDLDAPSLSQGSPASVRLNPRMGWLRTLADAGLVSLTPPPPRTRKGSAPGGRVDGTLRGRRFYRWLKEREGGQASHLPNRTNDVPVSNLGGQERPLPEAGRLAQGRDFFRGQDATLPDSELREQLDVSRRQRGVAPGDDPRRVVPSRPDAGTTIERQRAPPTGARQADPAGDAPAPTGPPPQGLTQPKGPALPTDFVAWCGVVLRSLLAAQKSSPDAAMVGLRIDQLARAVFGDDEDIDALLHASDRGRALVDAYRELRGLGLIEDVAGNHLRVPRQQRDAVHDQGDLWRGICARSLDPDEERVLRALNRASEQPRDGYAFLKPVPYAELSAALAVADEDEATDRVDRIVGDLKAVGFVRRSGGQGNLSVVATYAGLAWETRRWDLEEDERLATSRSMMVDPIWSGRGVAIDERLCFVLMPFRPPFDEIYADHIKPTVERLPLDSRRADDIYGVRPIMEDIWEQLCRSRVVVADLTGRNPNVFYEVGIAHTLGKPVVLIAQSMDDVPFDLRHHRVIVYGYTPPGARKLEEALERTLRSVVSIPAAS